MTATARSLAIFVMLISSRPVEALQRNALSASFKVRRTELTAELSEHNPNPVGEERGNVWEGRRT
jgi:hypothetical protein